MGRAQTELRRWDGYLPVEDYGLIGDGKTAALVGRDGAIDWMCLPRFDSPAVFCALLDAERGGHYTVTVDGLVDSRQRYVDDTGVLVTELQGREGMVELTDLLTLARGADLCSARSGRCWRRARWWR